MRGNLGLFVCPADRARLAWIIADRNSLQKHVWRARVVVLTGDRIGTAEIMRRTGLGKPSVWRWQERYIEAGVDGLLRDKTRPSRIPRMAEDRIADVIRLTLEEAPPADATHWTVRAMAERSGVSRGMVHRIWQEAGLVPHRFRQFKLSNDPAFATKIEDVVGLYVDPLRAVFVSAEPARSPSQPPNAMVSVWVVGRGSGLAPVRRKLNMLQACDRPVDRRKVANSGSGPNPARLADEARTSGNSYT
jgi:transposase